jgi:hypothetical protein
VQYLVHPTEFNYTDFVWDYYKNNTVSVNVSELKSIAPLDDYIFTGKVNNQNEFVFENQTKTNRVVIAKPKTSIPFFAGAQESFDAENNTPKAIIVRELTSAFEVGLLPAPSGTELSRQYFEKNRAIYYQGNPFLPKESGKQAWYDLYSKALHSVGVNEPIYTFAYDDALGQDGTLHDYNSKSPGTVTVTLGDMTGTAIPEVEKDDKQYSVQLIVPAKLNVLYQGKQVKGNYTISQAKMPLELTVNNLPLMIYVNPAMVKPSYESADGIVIERKADKVTVIFPAEFR